MSNILLIRTDMVSEVNPCTTHPLGIMSIASVLREMGHVPKLYDLRMEPGGMEGLLASASSFRPDVVGISSLTVESEQMKEVAVRIRQRFPDVPVLVGGPHATSYPEKVLEIPEVDIAVIGEGERTIRELIPFLESGQAPEPVLGIGYRHQGRIVIHERQPAIEDLDSLPFPAWDLLDLDAYSSRRGMSTLDPRPYMTLFTSRSCPYQCIYCHHVFGKGFRARSPENVIQEMEQLIRQYGIRDFELVDDIFNLDKQRTRKICDLIRERGLRVRLAFPNGLRADILTRDLIRQLRDAGTVSASFAVETASPRLQKLIRKNLDLEKAREMINSSVELGIITNAFFMLGFPTETREEILTTIRFATSLDLHTAQFFIVTPFLGTDMARMFEEKYKDLEADYTDYDYNKGVYNLSEVDQEELFRLQRYANLKFYIHPRRILRILRSYPDKKRLIRRFVTMARVKILTGKRGSFVK
jgi:anaerobic magnesium-protoporphyrin IX monomethyl ester cyclase